MVTYFYRPLYTSKFVKFDLFIKRKFQLLSYIEEQKEK